MYFSQDTYVALRALIEYTNRKRLRDVSALTVSVDAVALAGATRTLHIHNDDLARMQFIDVSVHRATRTYSFIDKTLQNNVFPFKNVLVSYDSKKHHIDFHYVMEIFLFFCHSDNP